MSQSAVVGFLCVCLSNMDLAAAEPESAEDLLDGAALTCILRVIIGVSGPGASHLAGKPSLAAVEKALIDHISQARSCSVGDAVKGLRQAGCTDTQAALSLAVATIVLAVTCDRRDGFIECIEELNDDTAEALQTAVQDGMKRLPGIELPAGEPVAAASTDAAARSAGDLPGRGAGRGTTAATEGDGDDSESLEVLRAENVALRAETESLRQRLAQDAGASAAGTSVVAIEVDEDDAAVHRDMSLHLHKQVAQLEAALELAQAQRDDADAEATRLRDDLDLSRAAVVEMHRVRKGLDEARAEAALLSAKVAEAEAATAAAEEKAASAERAREAAAAQAGSEALALRKQVQEAKRDGRERMFELTGVQTKAAAAEAEMARLRKLLEAVREAKEVAEARALAAEGRAAAWREGSDEPETPSMAAEAAAAQAGARGSAQVARLEAEVAALRAELVLARAGTGDDGAAAHEAEDALLQTLKDQLAAAEARAMRAETDAAVSRGSATSEMAARMAASEAEARTARSEAEAKTAELSMVRRELESAAQAAQEEAESERARADTLQAKVASLEEVARVRSGPCSVGTRAGKGPV